MKYMLMIVASLAAGFLGGAIGARVSGTRADGTKSVVRARSFELVDETGHAVSFWGVDRADNAVLAFGRRGPSSGDARPRSTTDDLNNPDDQMMSIGSMMDGSPVLKMRGFDHRVRTAMYLTPWGKPMLLMFDANGPRISLGLEQSDTPGPEDDNWTLVFAEEQARIGIITKKENGKKSIRGILLVKPDAVEIP